jgi:hypothetical protein
VLFELRRLLSYSNVMATLAVFIALGGSSYAALRVTSRNVPKDALTGADIKKLTGKDVTNNSLTGADVKKLTSADVANGRLLAEDFAPGQLPKGERGETGASGSDAASMVTGSTESGGIGAQAGGGANVQCLPVSGVRTGGVGSCAQLSPAATVVARDLSVKLESALPPDSALRFVLMANGTETALGCTVAAGATTCHDVTNRVTIAPGSELVLRVTNPGTASSNANGGRWGWRATTP